MMHMRTDKGVHGGHCCCWCGCLGLDDGCILVHCRFGCLDVGRDGWRCVRLSQRPPNGASACCGATYTLGLADVPCFFKGGLRPILAIGQLLYLCRGERGLT